MYRSALVVEDTQEIFDEWKGRQASWCVPKFWLGFEYPIQYSLCVSRQLAGCFLRFFPAGIAHSVSGVQSIPLPNIRISRIREMIHCTLLSLRSLLLSEG